MDIGDAWKATCRVVLGKEIGGLEEYEKYLLKYTEPVYKHVSSISGKPVTTSKSNFCGSAKFILNDETGEYGKMFPGKKLDINKIKDIDSILQALSEQFYYAGNQFVGNCREVVDSDLCVDSSYVHNSTEIYGSKYMAYCNLSRFDEYVFGSTHTGESKYLIKCFFPYKLTRAMETLSAFTSSDCYYCARIEDCTNCLFSFNQKQKHNLIGNVKLDKKEHSEIKAKLLGEMADTLKAKKSLPTIIDMISG